MLDELIDRIYEAATLPELWPRLLDEITIVGKGHFTALFTLGNGNWHWVASEYGVRISEDYLAEGWPQRTDRVDRLIAARHAGFVGDLDVYTLDEMDREPVFTEFHRPRGLGWGAATAISVPSGDMLIVDVERRFEAGPVEPETVQALDLLRPHLARAGLLSARLAFERVRATALALDLIGLPAAVLSREQKIIAANPRLEALMPNVVLDRRQRVALANPQADALPADALARSARSWDAGGIGSVPIPATEDRPAYIVHVVPIRRAGNDVFYNASAILVVTPVVPAEVPTADVLPGLFDPTPAEARIARSIAELHTIDTIAANLGVSRETIRTQLKAVLAKTGMNRQGDLAALLSGSHILPDSIE